MEVDTTQLLTDYITSWNSHDVDKLLSFFGDNPVYEDVSLGRFVRGKKDLKALLDSVFVDIAGLEMEIKSIFGTGNWGASEWIMSGKFVHSSDPALVATGKYFSIRGATIFELSNGKIVRNTDYLNLTAFLQQTTAA